MTPIESMPDLPEIKPITTELARLEPPAPAPVGALSLESAFRAVVDGTIKAEHVAVMKELLAMDAERKFNAAFVSLQADLPTIVATTVITNRGKYERFEDIMRVVGPLLTKHGFTVSFSQDFKENRIVETCTLSHAAGHSRPNSFAVRAGGRADSDTQADCKASTTAKRNALCNALNIVIRQDVLLSEDNDATIEGDPNAFLTPALAFEIEHRAQEVQANIPALLKFAGAASFATIAANKYTELDAILRRKEQAAK